MVKIKRAAWLGVGSALLLAVTAAGCGSGDSTATDSDGITTVKVGTIASPDTTVLVLGEEKGIFKKYGIHLDIQYAQGGAAIVPPVVSGQYQLGFSNAVSVMQGVEQGLPLQVLAPSGSSWGEPDKGILNLYASKASGITDAADLEGKTVAVNTLGNLLQVLAMQSIAKAGGDPATVKFVEMAPPDMVAAMAKGTIDGAMCNEPFCSLMKSQGDVMLADTYDDLAPGKVVIAGTYFANQQAIAKDPELYKNIQAALSEASAYATAHPDEARAAITKVVPTMDAEAAKSLLLNNWPSELTPEMVSPLADQAVKYGLLEGQPDLDSLLWNGS